MAGLFAALRRAGGALFQGPRSYYAPPPQDQTKRTPIEDLLLTEEFLVERPIRPHADAPAPADRAARR